MAQENPQEKECTCCACRAGRRNDFSWNVLNGVLVLGGMLYVGIEAGSSYLNSRGPVHIHKHPNTVSYSYVLPKDAKQILASDADRSDMSLTYETLDGKVKTLYVGRSGQIAREITWQKEEGK